DVDEVGDDLGKAGSQFNNVFFTRLADDDEVRGRSRRRKCGLHGRRGLWPQWVTRRVDAPRAGMFNWLSFHDDDHDPPKTSSIFARPHLLSNTVANSSACGQALILDGSIRLAKSI